LKTGRIRFGAVTFADNAVVALKLGTTTGENRGSEITESINSMEYTGGGGSYSESNTHLGLAAARTMFEESGSDRLEQAIPIVVIITDGHARNSDGTGTRFWFLFTCTAQKNNMSPPVSISLTPLPLFVLCYQLKGTHLKSWKKN
jgi:hypothetical protein